MPQFEWKEEDMKYMLCFFPRIGAVTGGLIYLWKIICDRFGVGELCYTMIGAAIPVLVTGGFHVDGFMDTMDICSLFGNALDNAIECERKLTDKSKRMIHLTLTTQKQFLLFQVENYCTEPLNFRDGLPVTTKGDAGNHGFGLKSIQLTAKKYGGSAVVQVNDNWFVLKVLIPLPAAE